MRRPPSSSLLAFLLIGGFSYGLAQDLPDTAGGRSRFSGGAFLGYTQHRYFGEVDLSSYPTFGGGNCGIFNSGNGGGIAPALFLEYALSQNLGIGFRVLMEGSSVTMSTPAPGATEFRRNDGSLVPVESQNTFGIELSGFSAEIYGTLKPFSIPLVLMGGPKFHFATGSDYTLQEELLSPEDISFFNGTRTRQFGSGTLGTGLRVGILLGAGYALPVSNNLELRPEIGLGFYVNSLSPYGSVFDANARGGFAVRYTFNHPAPTPPPPPPSLPPPPPPSQIAALSAELHAYGLSPNREEIAEVQVSVESMVQRNDVALLPYIFFEEKSSQIPSRYGAGRPRKGDNVLDVYYKILDIVGDRLKANPTEKILLVGTVSNTGEETGATYLAGARAENIKRHLIERWKIEQSRIDVQARTLPEHPSNNAHQQGREENRRVEIVGSRTILGPATIIDTVMQSFTSPGIRYVSTIEAEAGLQNWAIMMLINGKVARQLSGELVDHPRLSDQLTVAEMERLAKGQKLSYSMIVTDARGAQITTGSQEIGVNVSHRTQEAPIVIDSAFSFGDAIIFDFNSAELHPGAREALHELRSRLPAGLSLRVTGYADETGDREHNRRLSLARARAVAAELKDFPVDVRAGTVDGPLFNNATPEGRFYSRSARVSIVPIAGTPGS